MTPREIFSTWVGAMFGIAVGVLAMILLFAEGVTMDTLEGINWFAGWVCLDIGIVVGMFLSSLFRSGK